MKFFTKLALLSLLAVPVSAQQITITGTVKDPNGVAYTNGRGRAILVPTNVFFTTGLTNPVPGSQSPVIIDGLDANGRFSVVLTSTGAIDQQTSNPQWLFTFCSAPILQFGPICFSGPTLALTSSQDITAQISAVPPPILPGGGTGGAPPAPPSGALQKAASPSPVQFSASSVSEPPTGALTGTLSIAEDMVPKGPNPYLDVRQFGVRGAGITGITANCTSGVSTVVISSASTFLNGDGVTLYGCGGANGMTTPSAPTVTPSIARTLTGVGDVVNSPTGSTTYNYKIISCNKQMGCTAASAAGTTTTGLATLGSQNVNITSMSRSGSVVTVTTSAPHGFVANAMVYINTGNSLSDTTFAGWYQVTGSADNTHFTFTSGQTTVNGASTSSTGGIAYWFDCNFLTWTVPSGAYVTYILSDRANPGTYAVVGVAKPVNGSFTDGTAYWEDYGATMEGNVSFGPGNTVARWLPAAPFSSATNNALTTTIASGAGTTNLTLNTSAGNTLTGTPIQFDDGPNLATAATNSLGKPVYIPLNVTPVINSITDLSALNPTFTLTVVGGLSVNETIIVGSGTKILGDPMPQTGQLAQFQLEGYPQIVCVAIPCVHNTEGAGFIVRGIQFKSNVNQMVQVLSDGGGFAQGGSNFDRVAFIGIQGGGGTQDQMSILFYLRGRPSLESAGAHIGRMNLAVNPISNNNGLTATPGAYCFDCGYVHIETFLFQQLRGMAFRPDPAGFHGVVRGGYCQGGVMPMFSLLGNSVGLTGAFLDIQNFTQDTDPHPLITYLPSVATLGVNATIAGSINSAPAGVSTISGNPFSSLNGTVTGQNTGAYVTSSDLNSNTLQQNLTDTSLLVVGNGEFGFALAQPAAPTIAVAAGTSNPVATYTVKIVWVDVNGKATASNGLNGLGAGASSASNSIILTTNNQNINLTPPAAPLGAVGYYMFYSTGGGYAGPMPVGAGGCGATLVSPVAVVNDIRATNCATVIPPGAASASVSSSGLYGGQLIFAGGGAKSVVSGTFSANRSVTLPDASGTELLGSTAYLTSTYTNATTTFSNVTGLSFPVAANTNYKIRCDLAHSTSATTTGFKFQWTGPSSPTAVSYEGVEYVTTTTFSTAGATAFSTSTGLGSGSVITDLPVSLTLTVLNGPNAGTVQLQAAATGAGTLTILPGSCSLQQ